MTSDDIPVPQASKKFLLKSGKVWRLSWLAMRMRFGIGVSGREKWWHSPHVDQDLATSFVVQEEQLLEKSDKAPEEIWAIRSQIAKEFNCDPKNLGSITAVSRKK